MGTPIELPEPGTRCPNCFDPGKKWFPLDTPNQMAAKITGLEKGDDWIVLLGEPGNGTYILTQAAPCEWIGNVGLYTVRIIWGPTTSQWFLFFQAFAQVNALIGTPCEINMFNLTTIPAQFFKNGQIALGFLGI